MGTHHDAAATERASLEACSCGRREGSASGMCVYVYEEEEASPDPLEKISAVNELVLGGVLKCLKHSLAMSFLILFTSVSSSLIE